MGRAAAWVLAALFAIFAVLAPAPSAFAQASRTSAHASPASAHASPASAHASPSSSHAAHASAHASPASTQAGTDGSQTFSYTGSAEPFTVPPAITSITISATGGRGGAGGTSGGSSRVPGVGGNGGTTTATVAVTPGQALSVFVGGVGSSPGSSCSAVAAGGRGGANGGNGGTPNCATLTCSGLALTPANGGGGGSGGGSSSVSRAGTPLVVAGGGGGGGGAGGGGGTTTPTGGTGGPGSNTGGGGGNGGGNGNGSGGAGGGSGSATGANGASAGSVTCGGGGGGGGGGTPFGGAGGTAGSTGAGGGGGGGGGRSFAMTGTGVSYGSSAATTNGSVTISWTAPPTTTTLTSSPNPSTLGQTVTLTATVRPQTPGLTPAPSGTVTFLDGTTQIGSGPLGGGAPDQAVFSTNSLSIGTHTITARYGGDSVYAGSTSAAVTHRVNPAAVTITTVASAGGTVPAQVSDEATLNSAQNPQGSVTFTLFGPTTASTCTGVPVAFTVSVPANGNLVVNSGPTTLTAAGTYEWVASFSGDPNNAAASSTCGEEPVTVGLNQPDRVITEPSGGGPAGTAQLTDRATVSGGVNPTGTVTFKLFGPDNPGCAPSPAPPPVFTSAPVTLGAGPNPSATSPIVTPSPTVAGVYQWVASYSGDAFNAPVSSRCSEEPVQITRATPTVTVTPTPAGPVVVGASVAASATVTGAAHPGGSVTFDLFGPGNTTCTGTPVFDSTRPLGGGAVPSSSFPTTAAGTYSWLATYNGDANNKVASSACVLEQVDPATPTISTVPSAGTVFINTDIYDTANMSGGFSPFTGTITIEIFAPGDTNCTGPAAETFPDLGLNSGTGVISGFFLANAAGTWHWLATYNGDPNNKVVSSGCSAEPVDVTDITYHPLTPFRIADTRPFSAQPYQDETLGPGSTLNVQVTGVDGVPSDATAAAVNVTVTDTTGSSYSFLTVFPAGQDRPLASNLNWNRGQTVSNLAQVGLGSSGQISFFNNLGQADVIVDLQGYYAPDPSTAGLFAPVSPFRIADTRRGSGQPNAGQTLGPGGSINIQATGKGKVPATGVSAVVVNLTGTNPTADTFLTVYPQGAQRPLASNLNLLPGGQTRAIRVIVPVGPSGQISVFNNRGTTDVVVDITGWFTDASSPGGGSRFTATTPVRSVDTRCGSGNFYQCQTLGPRSTLNVQVAGPDGIPSNITALSANTTVTDTTGISFLTVYPGGAASRPLASDLNWNPDETVANLSVVGVDGNLGTLNLYNNVGHADVILDISGYYQQAA